MVTVKRRDRRNARAADHLSLSPALAGTGGITARNVKRGRTKDPTGRSMKMSKTTKIKRGCKNGHHLFLKQADGSLKCRCGARPKGKDKLCLYKARSVLTVGVSISTGARNATVCARRSKVRVSAATGYGGSVSEEPPAGWCGKTTKHGRHFYQNPHDGRTWWCPGYTPII